MILPHGPLVGFGVRWRMYPVLLRGKESKWSPTYLTRHFFRYVILAHNGGLLLRLRQFTGVYGYRIHSSYELHQTWKFAAAK